MKKETHPDYHEISVEMTDGKTYKTRSTWGKAGDTLKLEIDPLTHPAWSKGTRKLVDTGGRLARFRQRFSGFGMDAPEGNAPEGNAPESKAAKEAPAPVERRSHQQKQKPRQRQRQKQRQKQNRPRQRQRQKPKAQRRQRTRRTSRKHLSSRNVGGTRFPLSGR